MMFSKSDREENWSFYLLPTVYTVAEGHHLELYLMTWDPYRVFLDERFQLDPDQESELADYTIPLISMKAACRSCSPGRTDRLQTTFYSIIIRAAPDGAARRFGSGTFDQSTL